MAGNKVELDMDLIELAYVYLKKSRKKFQIEDVLIACEKILQKVELINRKGKKIEFAKGRVVVDEKLFNKVGRK